MSKNSKIEWTDHTFNPWEGCTKVSPGCANCYAETRADRYGTVKWGKGQPRRRTSAANWRKPLQWSAEAQAAGIPALVFCASLADVLDPEVPQEWRNDLWALVRATPWLRWLILSKRFGLLSREEILAMLPPDWGDGWVHVWLGGTVENQPMADRRLPSLLSIPAAVHFLSMEPLLEEVDVQRYLGPTPEDEDGAPYPGRIDWVIVGGESGAGARPMHIGWARSLRDQCVASGTAFLFKQWGEWTDGQNVPDGGKYAAMTYVNGDWGVCSDDWMTEEDDGPIHYKVGKKKAGRLLDGEAWNEFPGARG